MIRFKATFTGHGASIEPEPGRLVLDTGNRLAPGVIDHHQDSSMPECTTSLIYHHPELVLDHVGGLAIEEVEIMLHFMPDFDAVASAYLASKLVENGEQVLGAAALADYALHVDQATLPVTRHPERTPYGIFAGIGRLIEAAPGTSPAENTPQERSYRMLDRGLLLMEILTGAAADGADLYNEGLFAGEHEFTPEQEIVREDYLHYVDDLKRGRILSLELPRQDGQGAQEVDLLIVEDPSSAMFKVWARQDHLYSPRGDGFTMLSVKYGSSRFVVSVDPATGVTLKGLGAALDEAETAKRLLLGLEREGPPRPGYNNSDPWYDGRAAIHNYTIVDAPRAGTVLDEDEVMAIVLNPVDWAVPDATPEI